MDCNFPLSMGFSRQEYWSGLPCPPPGDLPNPGIEPVSLMCPSLAGRFFTTSATWETSIFGAKCSSVLIQMPSLTMAWGQITNCIISCKMITVVVILFPSLTVTASVLKMSGEPIWGCFRENCLIMCWVCISSFLEGEKALELVFLFQFLQSHFSLLPYLCDIL